MASKTRAKNPPKTSYNFWYQTLGCGWTRKEFLTSEEPTLRAVIQMGILLQQERLLVKEVERKHYPVTELAKDLAPLVIRQWRKSNANFKPLVVFEVRYIRRKIQTKWESLVDILNGRVKADVREKRLAELGTLFDIITCLPRGKPHHGHPRR